MCREFVCKILKLIRNFISKIVKRVKKSQIPVIFPVLREFEGKNWETLAVPGRDHRCFLGYNFASLSRAIMRAVASIRARWEKACGKFPRCLPVFGSYSSA
jgi:hypothetical protein